MSKTTQLQETQLYINCLVHGACLLAYGVEPIRNFGETFEILRVYQQFCRNDMLKPRFAESSFHLQSFRLCLYVVVVVLYFAVTRVGTGALGLFTAVLQASAPGTSNTQRSEC